MTKLQQEETSMEIGEGILNLNNNIEYERE